VNYYVIIGNSFASVAAIEAIRRNDAKNPITVIAEESRIAYGKPLISYLLEGKVSPQQMTYRDSDFYQKNKVQLILGNKVVEVDAANRNVAMSSGDRLEFERLLIASGSRPFLPPIAGLNLKNVFTFVTWDDIEKLQKIAAPTKKAVVIGAGLIGLKAAESLTKIGVKVTVIELADYALSTVLDKGSAQIIQSVFEKAGVNFYFQTTVDEISGYNKAEKVKLRNGMELDCDFVVVAIGVIPNIELVKKSEFKTKRGILVDQYLQTNVEGIYAAGDVAEVYDPATDQYLWRPILPNAVRQGKIAGRNMSGEKVEFDNVIALNATTFFDLPVVSLGMSNVVDEKYEVLEQRNDTENFVKRIVLQNEVVVGAILVGKIDRAGIFRGLIKNRLNVRDFKEQLLKPDFGLIHLPKEYWYKEFTGEKI